MVVRYTTPASEYVVNLDGPHGNAFYLMSLAKELAHAEDKKASKMLTEMTGRSDYYHLVKTFDKYFGHLVTLETDNKELLEFLNAN
jgi:hypothetical protein